MRRVTTLLLLLAPLAAPAQTLNWLVTAGGAGSNYASGVALGPTGDLYVTGAFTGTIDLDGDSTPDLTSAGLLDGFLARYQPGGTLVWAIAFGGASDEQTTRVAVDALGNAYVTGDFRGTADFDRSAPEPDATADDQISSAGEDDFFLVSYDATGAFRWVATGGGLDNDDGYDVTLTDDGTGVFVGGHFAADIGGTDNSDQATFGENTLTSNGDADGFFAGYSADTGEISFIYPIGPSEGPDRVSSIVPIPGTFDVLLGGIYDAGASLDGFVIRFSAIDTESWFQSITGLLGLPDAIADVGVLAEYAFAVGLRDGRPVLGMYNLETGTPLGTVDAPGVGAATSFATFTPEGSDSDIVISGVASHDEGGTAYLKPALFGGAPGGEGLETRLVAEGASATPTLVYANPFTPPSPPDPPSDAALGIAIDAADRTFVVGSFTDATDFDQDGSDDATAAGQQLFIAAYAPSLLPVELAAFDAVADGSDVRLTWRTASEQTNAGFDVEMNQNGDWRALAFVPGAGTTTEAHAYAYAATGLAPGTYRFRLKQIDHDGAFSYSAEVSVTVDLPGAFALSAPYPNPFNPQTTFTLAVAEAQPVHVVVYDALGRAIARLHDGPLTAGEAHAFTFRADALTSGLYLVRASGATFEASRTVMLVK